MARPRSYRSEALVLKSAPFDEAGLIVTLYSRDAGKLKGVRYGVRKPTSKMAGHLEPLNRVDMALARSRPAGIDTITQAQILESFPGLKASLEGVSRGIYLAELVDGFGTEGSANPELYSLLVDTLRFLNDSPEVELGLRYFELHLLKCSGFMPELYRCVECREVLQSGEHLFSPDVGGTLCPRCHPAAARVMPLSVNTLKVLRFLDRASLAQLPSLRLPVDTKDELDNLLSVTLKYWLDKEIRSKRFIEHLEQFRAVGVYTRGAYPCLGAQSGGIRFPRGYNLPGQIGRTCYHAGF